ncbi:hypothetical protein Ciccas_001627 [Cichlidogyrus casuarinus]|uniref:Uncharacterized protein n=1 Tax=Cichlidogyrus casuarinus TaxID=1844966 RepID=A0ABD2QJH8_9PLAT
MLLADAAATMSNLSYLSGYDSCTGLRNRSSLSVDTSSCLPSPQTSSQSSANSLLNHQQLLQDSNNPLMESVIMEVKMHPLYPLLSVLLSHCEMATARPDQISSSTAPANPTSCGLSLPDPFLNDLKLYIEHRAIQEGTASDIRPYDSPCTGPEKRQDSSSLLKSGKPSCRKSSGRKSASFSADWPDSAALDSGSDSLDIKHPPLLENQGSAEPILDEHCAAAKITIFTRNQELDELVREIMCLLQIEFECK